MQAAGGGGDRLEKTGKSLSRKGETIQPFQNPWEQFVISCGWRQNEWAPSYPQAQEAGC